MKTLNQKALEGIASYKYKSGQYTWLDYQMTPYWNWVVELVPLWVAPNLLTLSGTICIIISTCILLYYSPHLNEAAPSWVYLTCAFSMFVYQTLDAIDGKQARRTGSSSPLGQLFDHGCDALCSVFGSLSAAAAVQLGPTWFSYSLISFTGVVFFTAQWDEYHSGTMSCGNGYFGVTEGQMVLMLMHIISGTFGPDIWFIQPIAQIPLTFWQFLFITYTFSNVLLCYSNLSNVLKLSGRELAKEDKGHKHVSKGVALTQLIPITSLAIGGALWITGPDAQDFVEHPVVYLFSVGIALVFLASRMIVAHMCKMPFRPQFRILIPLFFLLFNCYSTEIGLSSKPLLDPFVVSIMFGTCTLFVYLHYMMTVINEICDYLEINLLTIPPVKKE